MRSPGNPSPEDTHVTFLLNRNLPSQQSRSDRTAVATWKLCRDGVRRNAAWNAALSGHVVISTRARAQILRIRWQLYVKGIFMDFSFLSFFFLIAFSHFKNWVICRRTVPGRNLSSLHTWNLAATEKNATSALAVSNNKRSRMAQTGMCTKSTHSSTPHVPLPILSEHETVLPGPPQQAVIEYQPEELIPGNSWCCLLPRPQGKFTSMLFIPIYSSNSDICCEEKTEA